MKAIRIHEDGGPEVLRYEDVPDPMPAAGEVLIRLRAASLNHLDVWVRKGLPSVPKPRILGADGAGVVEALGAGVDGFEPGQRVVINPGVMHDGPGERDRRAHRRDARRADRRAGDERLPAPRRPVVRGGGRVPARLRDRLPDARDEGRGSARASGCSCGASAAASPTAAFQVAKALGARVIATSSSDAKLERAAELGADATVNHATGDVKPPP